MTGEERRRGIVETLRAASGPLSGAAPDEERKTETLRLQLLSRPAAAIQEADSTAATFAGALAGHLAGIDAEGRILLQQDGAPAPYAVVIGLVLYWLVSNLFSIVQQWVITRRIEGKPVFGRAPAA